MYLQLSPLHFILPFLFTPVFSYSISKPGCPDRCGDVSIPFPFGVGSDCSLDPSFNISCINLTDHAKPYVKISSNLTLEVVEISENQIRVRRPSLLNIACYNESGHQQADSSRRTGISLEGTQYTLSGENWLTAIGCDDLVLGIGPQNRTLGGGCTSYCGSHCAKNGSGFCSNNGFGNGNGCCRTPIPRGLTYLGAKLIDISQQWRERKLFRCSYAFIQEKAISNQPSYSYPLSNLNVGEGRYQNFTVDSVPIFRLDWRIGVENCSIAQRNNSSYVCKDNSECVDVYVHDKTQGYHCRCLHGYQGNPYHIPGCQDIDECVAKPCHPNSVCINTLGSFNCSCRKGYYGDARLNGTGCIHLPTSKNNTLVVDGFNATAAKADVGVILDLNKTVGKMCKTSISMAIEDFYSERSYNTMIVPHFRDASSGAVAAASAAIDLLKNTQVMAILGPQRSIQADFVIDIGDQVRVPIVSPATSPALSPQESLYFIRSSWCSASQAKAIAAIVKNFGWREVVIIYEDNNYGSGLVPFLTEGLVQSNALVSYQSIVSPSAGNDQILHELYKLKTMQTRVFVVNMLPALASQFFKLVKEAGMMNEGYAWIIADVLTSMLDSVDSDTIGAMQGVLGVKAYIPKSEEVRRFTKRWRKRFHQENPEMDRTELNVIGMWAYDSITALAEAVERVGLVSPRFKKPVQRWNLTDLEAIGTSNTGPSLAPLIRDYRFKGLSGDFNISNGQLQPSAFEIVNVIGKGENTVGFWTEKHGIAKELKAVSSTEKDTLRGILWPGQMSIEPKGWEIPTSGKKLRVGVPVTKGFTEFIKAGKNEETKAVKPTGFCIDVFEEVMESMPYAVQYEYIPFETTDGKSAGNYNDLVYQIYLEKFDAVVGDVTIVANRSEYVDFTFPYIESGVATIVPIKDNERKNAWIFMKPLTTGLWLTIGAFFVFTGFVVWVLEHRVNKHFRGPPVQQVGMMFWFSFSTLVFAHREKVKSNLTRFVVIVWVFVVLVLTSSYTANLTSMLTVQQLQPKITNINALIKNGEYVGYQEGSFVSGFLKDSMKLDSSKFRNYSTLEEYDDALSKGSRNGGVGAIVDELPYIRLFLSKYCNKYTMIGPTYRTSGFGFAFPKGSPLLQDVSRKILNLKEDEQMLRITNLWLGEEEGCTGSDGTVITSESLNLDSFRGLFLIAGISSSSALVVFLSIFMYENRCIMTSTTPFKQKLCGLARVFCQEKDGVLSSLEAKIPGPGGMEMTRSPAISISCHQDEDFSTSETETPVHHATQG